MDDDKTLHRTSRAEEASAEPGPSRPAAGRDGSDSPAVLKGRFELLEILGSGGMGVVRKAWDRSQKVFVAVKLINRVSEDVDRAIRSAAFHAEARKTLELAHPNIVRSYDFDVHEDTEFLTMELLEGESFDSVIRRYPTGVPWAEAQPLIAQLFDGVEFAHRERIVHSDLKPSNVFVTDKQVVKILDFGIAAQTRRIGETKGKTQFDPRAHGALTPLYASKEMVEGSQPDPRDDVYSLACVLYELLSGKHPFGNKDSVWAFENQARVERISHLTRTQNSALKKALALEARNRTSTIAKFRRELFARPNVVAITAAAAAVCLAIGVAWLLWNHKVSMPTITVDSPSAAQSGPSAPRNGVRVGNTAAVSSLHPSDSTEFERKCNHAPSNQALSALVEVGLKTQSSLLFATNDADQAAAIATMKQIASCLRDLKALGYESSESRHWLKDVEIVTAAK